ncbi:hypothetical protein BDV95DRAFT_672997 [Massariosphaeria phaeospora]|uniref:Leucine-rich repeat domain-containing protein n=1 Tax=Massariosphaeria phaeospora TaxID=100035 RepID=A0A7C8HYD0_9PLEO|nr:hypothetical protein BDV95DRAFT_672997 [Massariosphaeria phaeospora]
MASLRTIPTELRLTIAELLDARTCFKFAIADREHHALYSALLKKHKKLFARYNTIDTHGAGRLVWDVTKEIIEKPELAQYVEDVSFPNTRQEVWDPDVYPDMLTRNSPNIVPEELVRLYTEAAMKVPIMSRMLEDGIYDCAFSAPGWTVEQTIRIGSDQPIVALLIAMAENLRVLRFTEIRGAHDASNEIYGLIWSVVLASADPAQTLPLPLQNLTHVAISYADTEGSCEVAWAGHFCSLPALRGFAANKMGGSSRSSIDDDEHANLPKSNVKNLLFDWCFFHPEALDDILERTNSLETFVYTNGGACVSDEGTFAPRRVVAALLKCAAHSLEELILAGDEGDDDFEDEEIDFVSLRGFTKLRTLRCSWATFTGMQSDNSDYDEELPDRGFHTRESTSHEWAKALPESLEILHLEHEPYEEWEAFLHVLRSSPALLPNLKRVHAQNNFGRSLAVVTQALEEQGIAYDEEVEVIVSETSTKLGRLLHGQGVV